MVQEAVEEQVSDAVRHAMEAPLKARFPDLSTYDMKDMLHQCMFETQQHNSHEVHQRLNEALDLSMQLDNSEQIGKDIAEERMRKKKRLDTPNPPSGSPPQPPPPPPPSGSSEAPGSFGAAGSQQSQPPYHTHPSSS